MEPVTPREIWRRLETIHAVTYFAHECRDAYRQLGLRGFWMGYFAGRAAPLGAVGPEVVDAAFYNFHPDMVRRAIPDAWNRAEPEAILSARQRAATEALRRLVPDADSLSDQLLPLLTRAIARAAGADRTLFVANRDLAPAGSTLAGVWQAATTLREHRGDGHVEALSEAGIDGCEAHVLYAATEGVAPELLRDNRGWSTGDWDAATGRLRARGLLGPDARATDAGRAARHHIEVHTDELAAPAYAALDAHEPAELARVAALIAGPVAASGVIPFPNPMGLPAPNITPTRPGCAR